MFQRITTAILIIALVIPPLIFGGILLRILIFAICAISSYEIVSLRNKEGDWPLIIFTFISTIVMYNVDIVYYVPFLTFYMVVLFLIIIIDDKYNVNDICFILVVSLILTIACKGVVYIYDLGTENMFYLIVACYVTDTMAYFTGYKFGKHKMIPRISPKKTWEGAVGGYVFGFSVSLIFGLIFTSLKWEIILVSSFILPIISQIGDLSFSAIKRNYNVKDFGSIFPGHGGVLDRIDSLLFCIICFYGLIIIYCGV